MLLEHLSSCSWQQCHIRCRIAAAGELWRQAAAALPLYLSAPSQPQPIHLQDIELSIIKRHAAATCCHALVALCLISAVVLVSPMTASTSTSENTIASSAQITELLSQAMPCSIGIAPDGRCNRCNIVDRSGTVAISATNDVSAFEAGHCRSRLNVLQMTV